MNSYPNKLGKKNDYRIYLARIVSIVSLTMNACLELNPDFVQPSISAGIDTEGVDSSTPLQTNSTNFDSETSGDGVETIDVDDTTDDENSTDSTTTSSTTSSPKTSDTQPNDDFGGTQTSGVDDSGDLTDESGVDQETSGDTSTESSDSTDSTTTDGTTDTGSDSSTDDSTTDTTTGDSSTTDESGTTTGSDTNSTTDSGDSTDSESTDTGTSDTGPEPCVPEICYSLNASRSLDGTPWAYPNLYGYLWTAPESKYVVRAEVPTGEATGNTNFSIYSDYNNGQRPGSSMGGNNWVVERQVSWQGTDFSPSIPVVAGTKYWLVWSPPANAQAPVATSGQLNPYTWSSNGGASWSSGSQGRSMFRLYCCDTPQ